MGYTLGRQKEYYPVEYFDDMRLNAEFGRVSAAVNTLLYRMRAFADDGKLERGTVTVRSLDEDLMKMMTYANGIGQGWLQEGFAGELFNFAQTFSTALTVDVNIPQHLLDTPPNAVTAVERLARAVAYVFANKVNLAPPDASLQGMYLRVNLLAAEIERLKTLQPGTGGDNTALEDAIRAVVAQLLGGAAAEYDTLKKLADRLEGLNARLDEVEKTTVGALRYNAAQTLGDGEKAQVWANIGLGAAADFAALYKEAAA